MAEYFPRNGGHELVGAMNAQLSQQGESERFKEACAVMAAWNLPDAAQVVASGLLALQHRGQEGSGIVTYDGQWHRHAAAGLVAAVYTQDALDSLPGKAALGHNRYSTSGAQGGNHLSPTLEPMLACTINGNLPTTYQLDAHLEASEAVAQGEGLNDTEKLSRSIAVEMLGKIGVAEAVKRAYPKWKGAFAGAAMDGESLVAFRDEYGIRPLVLGAKDNGWVVASETCALD